MPSISFKKAYFGTENSVYTAGKNGKTQYVCYDCPVLRMTTPVLA